MSIVEKAIDKHLRTVKSQRDSTSDTSDTSDTLTTEADALTSGTPVVENEDSGQGLSAFVSPDKQAHQPQEERGWHINLDYELLRSLGVLPPENLTNHVADEFRRIKRPLLANAFGKGVVEVEHGNLIMLASALSGEGKTFTALNLAMSVARERERTVLLIDADVAKPHISRILDLESRPGLLDLVLDKNLDLGDVLVTTDVPGLRILPAGTQHRHATELLASDKMDALVSEIANRYPDRIVIFDSPPLLLTAEAQVLSALVGQVVMVVAAGSTKQSVVQAALELLDPSKTINLVLNKSASGAAGGDYYGSGNYGYQT